MSAAEVMALRNVLVPHEFSQLLVTSIIWPAARIPEIR